MCNKTSKFLLVQQLPLVYQIKVHNSCVCNELHALLRRHLIHRPVNFDARFTKKSLREMARLHLPVYSLQRATFDEIIDRYRGAKKRAYQRGAHLLDFDRSERSWSVVSMFVKAERISTDDMDVKVPRAIQFRKPQFNLLLATYLHPFEQQFYNLNGVLGFPIIAKGKNNIQRAEIFIEAYSTFYVPVVLLIDHSKLDSYVNVHHLKLVHWVYSRSIHDKYLRYLLHFQLRNRGYSKWGLKYLIEATRMSGDYDTGLGNTLLCVLVILVVFRNIKHYMLADGDDINVVIEKGDLHRVNVALFEKLGFKTVVNIVDELHQVEFCRAKLLLTTPPRFAREPRRALSNMSAALKVFTGSGIQRYIAGIGVGELSASNGVPILMPIALKMSRMHTNPIYDESYMARYGPPGDLLPITPEVRIMYADAWGISPSQQELYERDYSPHLQRSLLSWYNSLQSDASFEE
nr:MAG: RNA-dependent RNA polymerase [Riboviria sp.]